MDAVLSMVLASMQVDMARLDRVAMNIANAQTPGYKREVLSASSFAARVDAAPASIHTDMRPGTLKATGQALDFALSGAGWFEVSTSQGPAYTRQGNFRPDAAGRLVTQQGHAVMGAAGEIVLPSGTPVVDAGGRLFAGSAGDRHERAAIAQLRVVQFEPGTALQRIGDGLVVTQASPAPVPEAGLQVHQGFLENSNVSHMHEMVRLLESVRHLEAMQKVALGYEEMLGTSIRKLGEPA
jgi:flagellar basal-body rod protein FlgF